MAEKRAVVFSGGGAKGGYQIGAWKALNEVGFKPDIVTGTSVGALNGALMVLDEYDKAVKIWENMGLDTVFSSFVETENKSPLDPFAIFSHVAGEVIRGGGADFTPLQELVKGLMDETAFRNSPIDYGLVTTSFRSLSPLSLYVDDIPEGLIADYILASAACFPFMKSYKIREKRFVDGGYSDNLPIRMAAEKGATEIAVLNVGSFKKPESLPEFDLKLHYIHNRRPFKAGSMIVFNRELSQHYIRWGYLDGLKNFGKIDGYFYAFHSGEALKSNHLFPIIQEQYNRVFSVIPKGNRIEIMGADAVRSYFTTFIESYFDLNSAILICAEATAETLEVPAFELYTYSRFENRILKKFLQKSDAMDNAEFLELSSAIDKGLSMKLFRKALDGFNHEALAFYTTHVLMTRAMDARHRLRLWLIATLMPASFCMGLYCATLLKSRRMESPFPVEQEEIE